MSAPFEAVIFDADGTLVDTRHLIRHGQHEAVAAFLKSHDVPPEEIPTFEQFQNVLAHTIGGSARHTLEQTVRKIYETAPHRTEGMDFDQLHDLLNPIQDAIAPEFVKPYEGLSRLFSFLGEAGLKSAVFTSGTPHHVVRNFGVALPELGLTELFKDASQADDVKLEKFIARVVQFYHLADFAIVTCDDVTTHKPDPASLVCAMERLGTTPQKTVVVGDHHVDMQAGKNAGVDERIGITHGFSSKDELLAAGASATVDSLDELIARLQP